jgi:hypothetical protein
VGFVSILLASTTVQMQIPAQAQDGSPQAKAKSADLSISTPQASTEKVEIHAETPTPAESSIEHSANKDDLPVPTGLKALLRGVSNKLYFWRLRYYFVAQNASNCTLFYGLIQDDPLTGHASVEFKFPDGCNCHGYAQVTHLAKGRSVVGQTGIIRTKCSDGRKIDGTFITTSLTTGTAKVSDNKGNDYQATFGHTAEAAANSVNELRRKLGCPDCSAKDIELSVQGRVLPAAKDKSIKN